MQLKAGSRLQSTACDTQVIVVRAPQGEVDLRCGGHPLAAAAPAAKAALDPNHSGGSAMGKRYADEESGLEVLCAKPGPGTLAADGRVIVGTLMRYNKKSVTVITDNSERWNVSPVLLRRAKPRDITPTDPESIDRGIGPVCAERFGW